LKVFFDHNVPRKLRKSLRDHQISTAAELGWQELDNGALLSAVEEAGFEVMVTADKNITDQQNWTNRKLALVVLSTNNWTVIRLRDAPFVRAVRFARPGTFTYVEFRSP
jgi:hypothetical protein